MRPAARARARRAAAEREHGQHAPGAETCARSERGIAIGQQLCRRRLALPTRVAAPGGMGRMGARRRPRTRRTRGGGRGGAIACGIANLLIGLFVEREWL